MIEQTETYVLAANRLNDIIWRCSKKLSDDGELVDVVFAREKRLALEHLCKDTSSTPDVHLNVVFLPGKHDFGCPVVSG